MAAAISVRGLRKTYGTLEAVRGIDFDVAEGQVFGLLGHNGAGKTTVVEVLEGYRRRDGGKAEVLGMDPTGAPRALRERVGIVLQESAAPPLLTVRELLEMYAGYYPHPRPIEEVLDLVGMRERERERVRLLSGGQQRRLDLACGLVGDPDLIFLDEPTTGFDPSARRHAWEVVRGIRNLGKTVLLTTHYMDEAEQLCDTICVIAGGRVVAQGSPQELRAGSRSRARVRFRMPEDTAGLPIDTAPDNGYVVIETDTPTRVLADITGWAARKGVELEGLEVRRATLEDVYLELTE